MSDATLFRFISSYRAELDFRHTVSGRRYRVNVHDPARRPHPTDGLPIGAEVTEEWHRYRVAARNEDVAWFRRRPGLGHQAVVEQLAAGYPDLEPLTHADVYDLDEMQPSGDADLPERARPTPPPLGPGRLRITDTYRAYRRHGRFAATAAGYGHLHGWLTGTLRSTVDGQRWTNVNVPGTRRLRPAAGITVQALAVLVVAASFGAPLGFYTAGRNGTTQVATLAALVGLAVLVEGSFAIWYWRRRRRCDVPPPRPKPCADITTLAKAPDADIGSLIALKRDVVSWLDTHDLALRIQARPELAPVYERFLSLHRVGTLPSLLDDTTLTVLERPPGHSAT